MQYDSYRVWSAGKADLRAAIKRVDELEVALKRVLDSLYHEPHACDDPDCADALGYTSLAGMRNGNS
jgi:hypothetical protein